MLITSIVIKYFNPRSSCEERLKYISNMEENQIFQSTLLMRGATLNNALKGM